MAETAPRKISIGYVGLGLMGLPMARHLLSKGHAIRGFDIVPARLAEAASAGVEPCANAADTVRGADLILLNLPTTDAVEDVVFGAGGVAKAMQRGQIIVDFSTITVEKGQKFAARLQKESGCGWVDAPVSGGPPASGTGTLTVMAGGRSEDIEAVRPLMADVAARFTVMGPAGAGLAAKMINQMIVGCTHAVLAEALVVAEAAGIEAARMPECLAGGFADSPLLQKNYPRMAARDFAPQGYARQLLKDLEMVSAFVGGLKAPTPMTGEALNLYRMLIHKGHAELDTTAIVKIYER
jgi:3-hydroxyisobutyrate dehydrogenase-like beta-hydroxyacid dehydrogenase